MKTILLVDDERQLCVMFGLALRKEGYDVIEANSGCQGLALARQYLPDLILSDINMPGGDGSTLLRDLRNDPELKNRQVVLMTGRPDLATPRSGMEEGADDFLVKPVSIAALVKCVRARFDRISINWRVEDQMLAQLKSSVPSQLPHEFFTPMAGIIGLLEILRSSYPELAQAEVQDIHNDMYHSAMRLNRTLRNYLLLLDLQAASHESLPNPLSAIQVEESIRAATHEVCRLNNRCGDFSLQLDVCSIAVKPEDFTRMVEELVDNACKFSRNGTAVSVTLDSDGQLTVSDQGRGMTLEQTNRIGAFQQFDRKIHEQQGLGLGLILVKKLAGLCQAQFSIASKPGEGTQAQLAFSSRNTNYHKQGSTQNFLTKAT